MEPVTGKVYQAIGANDHNFSDGERIIYTGEKLDFGQEGILYIFKTTDPESIVYEYRGSGTQALDLHDFKEVE